MELIRLKVSNLRGIERLDWRIPKGRKVVCLIGPGDVGKTTIITAISWLVSDRWGLPVSINDFHDEGEPIVIEGWLSELPERLLSIDGWGLSLCSSGDDASLQEPTDLDGVFACLRLTVDWETLEPRWELVSPTSDPVPARSAERRLLGVAALDDRTDSQFRWSPTSALGRLTRDVGGAETAFREATIAARDALRDAELSHDLRESLDKVRGGAEALGAGAFDSLRPGIDLRGGQYGGVCLYDEDVPLSSYGLGTKRLAALSIQRAALSGRTTYLIDEIESGLEPHRVVGLIESFRSDSSLQQAFMTTHSPAAVESCDARELAVVARGEHETSVTFLPEELQGLHRSSPSPFLARRILVCEGATEEGLLRALVRHHDRERRAQGRATSGAYGVSLCNGGGGARACEVAESFHGLGYDTFLLLDADDATVDERAGSFALDASRIHRWERGDYVESAIFGELSRDDLIALLRLTIEEEIVSSERVKRSFEAIGVPLEGKCLTEPATWNGVPEDELRRWFSRASVAKSKKHDYTWYKSVSGGMFLGEWLVGERVTGPEDGRVADRLFGRELAFVYPETGDEP